MKKIIIDCDPGHDDAVAICLAAAYKDMLSIEGITTVGGNQTIDKVTNNALKVVELLGEDVKVIKGAEGPLIRKLKPAPEAHGSSGMDGPELPDPEKKVEKEFAVEYIASILRSTEEKITLVAIGPLTNIALVIKSFPGLVGKIEEISLMGGGLSKGNITSEAEFNFYIDPEAAKIVFESGIPITMSGLDVTDRSYLLEEDIEAFNSCGKISKFVYELLEFYTRYGKVNGYTGASIHDACAVMWLIKPEIFKSESLHVDIYTTDEARGMSKADFRVNSKEKKNAKVLLDVDRTEFISVLTDAIKSLD